MEEVVQVAIQKKRMSALSTRISQGKADPITPEERRIVADLRARYEQRVGAAKRSSVRVPSTTRMASSR